MSYHQSTFFLGVLATPHVFPAFLSPIVQVRNRSSPLLTDLRRLETIGENWHDTGYVFVQENGLPLYPHTPSDLFKKLLIKADLRPTRLHDQRHLHATELLRLGEPLHVVANRLGHRDAMVTATIYAHVSDQQAETASATFANAVQGGR